MNVNWIRSKLVNSKLLAWLIFLSITAATLCHLSPWSEHDAKVQIRVTQRGTALPDGFFLYQKLAAKGIAIESITPDNETLIIRFNTLQESQAAQKILKQLLSDSYSIS